MNICASFCLLVGPSGLEPPTSCLSGTRSNLLSYEPMWLVWILFTLRFFQDSGTVLSVPFSCVSIELFSRAASRKVSSPLQSLTSVFGMGTGGPSAFVTLTFQEYSILENWTTFLSRVSLAYSFDPRQSYNVLSRTTRCHLSVHRTFSIERRWSSRTFRYGYLVTT